MAKAIIKKVFENPSKFKAGEINLRIMTDGPSLIVNNARAADYPDGATIEFEEGKAAGKSIVAINPRVELAKPTETNHEPKAQPAPGVKPGAVDQQAHPVLIRRNAQTVAATLVAAMLAKDLLPMPKAENKRVGAVEAYLFALTDKLYNHALGIKAAAPKADVEDGDDTSDVLPD